MSRFGFFGVDCLGFLKFFVQVFFVWRVVVGGPLGWVFLVG